ncbi:hypothetical protein IVB50_09250 [Bradyrhizobium sp. 87]|nr:hypothetical protein [Bradyrhizobium sp. 87]
MTLCPRQAVQACQQGLEKLKTYLGRIIRDIGRKLGGNADLLAGIVLERMLARARRVLEQKQHRRGPKVYSLHEPEVECIGKGKAHRPYEFGVKVSVATTLAHAKGGQFVTHEKAPPGDPYDGHTLATVIPDMEALIAIPSSASSPTRAIAATMPHPITSSGCSRQGRSGG